MIRCSGATLLLACTLGAFAVGGCSSGTSQYRDTLAAADAAAQDRKTDEAARLYQRAAREATKTDLAVEAAYREASMWKRQGEPGRALTCLESLAAQHSHSNRGPRIWLDLGRLREGTGDSAGARQAYRKVLSYRNAGLAPRAADALVHLMPGSPAGAYGALLAEARQGSDLAAFLHLRLAQAQAAEGNPAAAIQTCESLAEVDPLPTGIYTDDALLLAATLRRTLGDPKGALATIDAILAAQEKAALVGSYERSAFAEARWLAADVHQLDRADPRSAEGMLEDLVRLDEDSRLRDDALFRAAWLAHHERADEATACARAKRLAELDPPSPLGECLGEVCSSMPQATARSRRCGHALVMAQGLVAEGVAQGQE